MNNFILFKNSRYATKLNLQLSEGLNSIADLTLEQAIIIYYITKKNKYTFTLSDKSDLKAITIDEKSINLEYCKEVVNNEKSN